jgi:hypothetical protein
MGSSHGRTGGADPAADGEEVVVGSFPTPSFRPPGAEPVRPVAELIPGVSHGSSAGVLAAALARRLGLVCRSRGSLRLPTRRAVAGGAPAWPRRR